MNNTALVIVGGFSSPDVEWKLSPIHKMSGTNSPQGNGPDIFIFKKCSLGLQSIEHIGKELLTYVRKVREKGYSNIFVMGHSMGGLVCRVAEIWSQREITGIITVATPHAGSSLAPLAQLFASGRQMIPGSSFLRKLDENPAQCPVLSIICQYDELVPRWSAEYPFGGDIKVHNLTHIGPIFSKNVAADVLDWINEGSRGGYRSCWSYPKVRG